MIFKKRSRSGDYIEESEEMLRKMEEDISVLKQVNIQ